MGDVTGDLGAFVEVDGAPVHLDGAGRGPLAGLTFAAKDLFDVAGHRTGAGNPTWLATHPPAPATAAAVATLVAAGATLTGKTVSDELAYSILGVNHWYGTPANPAAPDRLPGGSSSGSASAVAGGVVDFAIGTDTGGSVRVPASWCGLFGIRPTHGATDLRGVVPLAPSFDTCGWFARSAARLREVGDVLLSPPASRASAPVTRLLLVDGLWALADEPTQRALAAWLATASLPLDTEAELEVPGDRSTPRGETFRVLQSAEIERVHGRWLAEVGPVFGPDVQARIDRLGTDGPQAVRLATRRRASTASALAARLGPGTALVLPTTPGPAPARHGDEEERRAVRPRIMELTALAGLGRLPQVSLPVAQVDGAPVGLSLVGGPGTDHSLLDLAVALALEAPPAPGPHP